MEKRTLLQKYEIPISHLDFDYIKKCKDTKELERIVAILRSGEEGYYAALTKCAEEKLKEIKPHSRALRTEDRVLTKSSFSSQEWKEHSSPIIEWSSDIKNKDTILSTIEESSEKVADIELPPIRKCGRVLSSKQPTGKQLSSIASKQTKNDHLIRAASTDYSQWDKYDADAEVLKMDLEEERVKEHVSRMNRINQDKSKTNEDNDEKKSKIYDKLTPIERERLSEDYKILGNEYFKANEFTKALEHYSRCIQIRPSPAGHNNRAITNIKLLRYTDAIEDCDECLRQEPGNVKALLRRAEACLHLKRKIDAFHAYDQVKSIDPENSVACKALEKLRVELGVVAPSTATRIRITEKESKPKPKPEPVKNYDLAELIKPNRLVKSTLIKTMESLGKKTDKRIEKSESTVNRQSFCKNKPEIRLSIQEPIGNHPGGSCLIQEI